MPDQHSVILISIDGMRADALHPKRTPNLWRLAQQGTHAPWMEPVFPTLTFPNHYTLVTGLYPGHHGIISNTMHDPAIPVDFHYKDRKSTSDSRWWNGGEPIWITAQRQGLTTATMFWPGSEEEIRGARPNYWLPFDASWSVERRVNQVLNWLDLPKPKRPQLITLYFDQVDQAEHHYGLDSPEALEAMQNVDAGIKQLLVGLNVRKLSDKTNLVVVSDHGTTPISKDRVVFLEDLVDVDQAQIMSAEELVNFVPKPGLTEKVEAQLLKPHAHVSCYRREEPPAHWHFGSHSRIAPLLCLADEGWQILRKEAFEVRLAYFPRATHGFDNKLPSMRALFIAAGPDVKRHTELPPFSSVEIYSLLAELLKITPSPNDGNKEGLVKQIIQIQPIQ